MDGKEAIINKIISDAELKAQEISSETEKKAEDLIANAKEWVEQYNSAQQKLLDTELEEIISKRNRLAELDSRKLILKTKQDLIEKVLGLCYEKLAKLSKKDYLSLIEKLIEKNAEDNDEIVLSKDNVLSKKDISSLKVFGTKKLSVSDNSGDFIGGIRLVGKNCDKDLTFKSIIDSKKDSLIIEISKCLFD